MLRIQPSLQIPESDYSLTQIRAQGAGGQNVNKVASAVQLRFDIPQSSLPDHIKTRLLNMHDKRLSNDGIIVIKAQNHRTYERNKEEALQRLVKFIGSATVTRKKRKATKPSKNARQRRVDRKTKRGKLKQLRKKLH